MMWVPEVDASDRYTLLACVPAETRLYVLIEGPGPNTSPDAGPEMFDMTVRTAGGQELVFRSLTRSRAGGKTKTVFLGQVDGPETVESLDIRLQLDGREVFAAVAVPVRTEPA